MRSSAQIGTIDEVGEVFGECMLDIGPPVAEQLERVFANGLQHPEPCLASGIHANDEVVVDERRERVEIGAADLVGGSERGTRRQRREAAEHALLARRKQVDAPANRLAQRLLARGQVARPAGEQRQPVVQSLAQHARRECAHARGCELDRERQAVDAAADLADVVLVLVRELERWVQRARALFEQRDRVVLRERADREDALTGDV